MKMGLGTKIIFFVVWVHIFITTSCAQNGDPVLDLVFVVDSSGSIRDANPDDGSYDNWNTMLTFINEILDGFDIGSHEVRVGLVIYSNTAYNLFYLYTYPDVESVKTAVISAQYIGGTTNTSGGIHMARTQQFTSERGDRFDAPNYMVVITDGATNVDYDRTIPEAKLAHDAGVSVISIGVGDMIDADEIRNISSHPHVEGSNWFRVTDFSDLEDIAVTIISEIQEHEIPITLPERKWVE